MANALQGVMTAPKLNAPRRVMIEGVDTLYHEFGSGPETIVYVFGGQFGSTEAGSSAHVWDFQVLGLADRYHCVAFDKLGQGHTANPLCDEDYTMDAVIRHAAKFVEMLGKPVHIVGHSRGGFIATRLTLEYPHLFKSLTIVASGTLSPTISTNELTLTGNPHAAFSRESSRWVYEGYAYDRRSVTEDWVDRSFEVVNRPEVRETSRKMGQEGLATRYFLPGLSRLKRETLQWMHEGRLQRPVEIIWGANDRTVALQGAFEIFDMISPHQKNVELSIINHAGHFVYREHPARFNQLLSRFVDTVVA